VNDELSKCYELLGVAPGTSGRELKQAYLDMAKVWHPDRFSHDPRLQQKAQEKLKEINEAYELLKSGRAARHARAAAPTADTYTSPAADARRGHSKLMLTAAVCAALVVALYALTQSRAPHTPSQMPVEEEKARAVKEREQTNEAAVASANQSARGNERTTRRPTAEAASNGEPAAEPSAQQLRPMPTVTVNIDSATGLLATKDCPTRSRMTYPAGNEPKQYCTTPHKAQTEAEGSRVKSAAKRLASPNKWLGDGKAGTNAEARDALPPGDDRPQHR
jgi:hypothetical protein